MRKKLLVFGVDMPRWLFMAVDHLVHTAPAALLLASIVRRKQRVHPMNSVYVLMLYTWFSFRQSSTLDVSNVYVPHPWRRAWAGVLTALLAMPSLVHALNARHPRAAVLRSIILLLPWLSSKLDPTLRATYNFECMLASQRASELGPRRRRSSLTLAHSADSIQEAGLNRSPGAPPPARRVLKRGSTANAAIFTTAQASMQPSMQAAALNSVRESPSSGSSSPITDDPNDTDGDEACDKRKPGAKAHAGSMPYPVSESPHDATTVGKAAIECAPRAAESRCEACV